MKQGFLARCNTDKRYRRFVKQLESGKYAINLSEHYNKVNTVHATRDVRRITVGQVVGNYQKVVIQAFLQNQQYRSDLVDLRKEVYKINALLYWHIEELSNYLTSKYPVSFKSLSNQQSRDACLNTLFSQGYAVTNQFDTFIEYVDGVIEDIDKAHWTLSAITKVLEINASKLPEL